MDTELVCINHPGRTTRVRCSSCDSPICVSCMRQSSVGMKCPSCAAMPKSARRIGKPQHLAAAALGGFGASVLAGAVIFGFNFGFILLPLIAGLLIGETISKLARRQNNGLVIAIGVIVTILGFMIGPGAYLYLTGGLPNVSVGVALGRQMLLPGIVASLSAGYRITR